MTWVTFQWFSDPLSNCCATLFLHWSRTLFLPLPLLFATAGTLGIYLSLLADIKVRVSDLYLSFTSVTSSLVQDSSGRDIATALSYVLHTPSSRVSSPPFTPTPTY